MAALVWGASGSRYFESGVDRGVLYPKATGIGVVWDGLIAVNQRTTGGEPDSSYLDGYKFAQLIKNTAYQADIVAFSSPAEFRPSNGVKEAYQGVFFTQQPRVTFGFSYRTLKSNDLAVDGYKIHLVYNARANPTAHNYQTLESSATPTELSWTINAVPPDISGKRPTVHLVIDTNRFVAAKITALENLLYGTSSTTPQLPTQAVVSSTLA